MYIAIPKQKTNYRQTINNYRWILEVSYLASELYNNKI